MYPVKACISYKYYIVINEMTYLKARAEVLFHIIMLHCVSEKNVMLCTLSQPIGKVYHYFSNRFECAVVRFNRETL